jgi:hypothetical protein
VLCCAAGGGGRLAQTVAPRASAGFTKSTDVLLLAGLAVLAVAFLLVLLGTRRSDRDVQVRPSSPPPPGAHRPPVGPPEEWPSAVPLLPQRRVAAPPPGAHGSLPDAPSGLPERGPAARHLAAAPPTAPLVTSPPPLLSSHAPPMLSNQALLTGHVTGPEGSPVSAASLTVSDFHGSPVGVGRTATDGRYRLHLPTGGTYLLVCTAEGHQSTTIMVTVAAATLVCDIVLAGAGGIDGWLRHHQGEPAAGAVVTLTDLRGEVVASTVAGPAGTYRLTGLNSGEYTFVVSAAGARPSAFTVQVPANGVRRVDLVLQSNGALRGTVRAANGARPVPDASVALVDGSGGVVAAIVTGADGEYVFAEVPPGGYTLIASGYPPVATRIELTGERTEVRDVMLGPKPQQSGVDVRPERG